MDRPIADTAFRAMLAHYEHDGWEVRTLDADNQRATVRTVTQSLASAGNGNPVSAPAQYPACRRLWVDAAGNVQETNVPC